MWPKVGVCGFENRPSIQLFYFILFQTGINNFLMITFVVLQAFVIFTYPRLNFLWYQLINRYLFHTPFKWPSAIIPDKTLGMLIFQVWHFARGCYQYHFVDKDPDQRIPRRDYRNWARTRDEGPRSIERNGNHFGTIHESMDASNTQGRFRGLRGAPCLWHIPPDEQE